jgi:hypothetical protein
VTPVTQRTPEFHAEDKRCKAIIARFGNYRRFAMRAIACGWSLEQAHREFTARLIQLPKRAVR